MIVTIHPTSMCNQCCSYCVSHKGNMSMSTDTLINTIDFISNVHWSGTNDYMEFHSVEPTLRGLPFFIKAEQLLTDFGIDKPRLLASNMTSDNWIVNIDQWCAFLSNNNWMMNVSLDGPQYIHDKNRGTGTWEKVISSLIKIKEHQIQYGTIAVIKDSSDLNDIYDFFVDINQRVQFNPVMPFNDISNALCQLFDRWLTDHKPINIDPFSEVFKYHTSQSYNSECPNICCHDIISIAPDGSVRPCGFFWDNSDLKDKYVYGNVNTQTFDEIWYSPAHQRLIEYVECIPDDCMHCPYLDFCGTGCTYCKHAGADKCGHIKSLLEHTAWLGDN